MATRVVNYVKEFRENAGLTQRDLSNLMGVSIPCVSAWEIGRNEPSISRIRKMCELFNCSINDLYPSDSKVDFSDRSEIGRLVDEYRKLDAPEAEKLEALKKMFRQATKEITLKKDHQRHVPSDCTVL